MPYTSVLPQAAEDDLTEGQKVMDTLKILEVDTQAIDETISEAISNYKMGTLRTRSPSFFGHSLWKPLPFQQRVTFQQTHPSLQEVTAGEYIGHAVNHDGTARKTIETLYTKDRTGLGKHIVAAMIHVANRNLFASLDIRESISLKRKVSSKIKQYRQKEKHIEELHQQEITDAKDKYKQFLTNKGAVYKAFNDLATRVAQNLHKVPSMLSVSVYEETALEEPNPQTMKWDILVERIRNLLPKNEYNYTDPGDWPELTQLAFRKEVGKQLTVAGIEIVDNERYMASDKMDHRDYDDSMKDIFLTEEQFQEKISTEQPKEKEHETERFGL